MQLFVLVLMAFHHTALPCSPDSDWVYTPNHSEEMMPRWGMWGIFESAIEMKKCCKSLTYSTSLCFETRASWY